MSPNGSGANSGGGLHNYQFHGMDDTVANDSTGSRQRGGGGFGSSQSVVSMGSEFAQRAKSLVHLLNCQMGERGKGEPPEFSGSPRNMNIGGTPI